METPLKEMIFNITKNGETFLYNEIIQMYQKQIFHYCYRMLRNKQDAEDATQEVFLKSFQNLESYQYDSSFSAWLYKIAYHYCLNKKRKQQIFQKLKHLIPVEAATPSVEVAFEERLFSPAMEKALAKLSLEEQNLIILRVFEEMSFEEIAVVTGKGMEAVKKRYSRTKNKLKEWLQEREEENYEETVFLRR